MAPEHVVQRAHFFFTLRRETGRMFSCSRNAVNCYVRCCWYVYVLFALSSTKQQQHCSAGQRAKRLARCQLNFSRNAQIMTSRAWHFQSFFLLLSVYKLWSAQKEENSINGIDQALNIINWKQNKKKSVKGNIYIENWIPELFTHIRSM